MPNPSVAKSADPPLRVLLDVPKGSWTGNPYMELLINGTPADVKILGYQHRIAVSGKYDVVHLHWPEHRLAGHSFRERMRRRRMFLAWMRRLRREGIPVVRTRHNRAPHTRMPALDRLLLRTIPPLVSGQVWLTESSMAEAQVDASATEVVIPHGDFAPWIAATRPDVDTRRTRTDQVRLATFGAMKPYKNLEESIAVLSDAADFSLVIAGSSRDPGYIASLTALAGSADNVEIRDGRLTDDELLDLVIESDAVLAAYKNFYNSSVAFLALSLGRPVLAPDGPMTRELRDEFGPEWIGLYAGSMTPESLRHAWSDVSTHGSMPNWSPQRSWPAIGRAHADLYWQVSRRKAARPT